MATPGAHPTSPAPATLTLEDIHVPPPPGWWPPAPGWWLLAALLLALLGLGLWRWRRWRRRRQQWRQIEAELQTIQQRIERGEQRAAIAAINRLLRKLALMSWPRSEIASLTGRQWLEFLDRSGETRAFTAGPGRILAEGPYVAHPQQADLAGLMRATRDWIDKVAGKRALRPLYPDERPGARQSTEART